MCSNSREEVVEVFDALEADLRRALELSFDVLTTPERLAMLERCERVRRRLPAVEHPLINGIAEQADAAELGGKLPFALADRLRITRAEAARRIREAEDLGPRRTLTGEPLEPVLAATAEAQRAGRIGPGHVAVIRDFWHRLPDFVDVETRGKAEAQLARQGGEFRPDQLSKLADKLTDCLNPDGNFTDEDRARRRSFVIGKQGIDGMSAISGYVTPEARATLDAVLAKLGAPGMCNPADAEPCTSGTPSQAAIDADTRSTGQRNHDALNAAGRALLASGNVGQHNGLPASIIVTTTLRELESGCGTGRTGGGSWLPMSDVIRLASHAHHYLAIFDEGTAIGLYHTKRLASPGQRIVLHAKDRGCSFPNCDVPGYLTEVHHVTDYAQCRETGIDGLTQACRPHHKLVTSGGWTTRTRKDGLTEWIPPPHLDRGQPRTNVFHHPEKLLRDGEADDDPTPR
ncbi:HNH endonuclease signature motif containing protein [Mycobacterium sp.]|uniref:HNH endonuclease signature motif containing protein n=1 Tax=Mycobacterium sp. TaxID=1785 RepID=UPI0012789B81|nr:HNH endonuclease signature motif containing protein [Mycobacterium sp.]KAA8966037.1 MAG: HNH endonuclease [Mycobacterium sp.]